MYNSPLGAQLASISRTADMGRKGDGLIGQASYLPNIKLKHNRRVIA
jgi:hypothetical protein